MVRRYDDLVEVRPAPDGDRPASFLWRGRLYVVRDVLGHWRERRAWWTSTAALAVHGDGPRAGAAGPGATGPDDAVPARVPDGAPGGAAPEGTSSARAVLAEEREVWRVEASRGRVHGTGVFDLCRQPETREDAWRLVRVAD